MGMGISIICKSCNSSAIVKFGAGIFQEQLSLAENRIQNEVKKFRGNNKVIEESMSMDLFYCPKCYLYRNELNVKLIADTGEEYISEYYCNNCKKILELRYDGLISKLRCHNCLEKSLEVQSNLIIWD